jgi:Domain of unknown function (DUF5666)
MNLTRVTLATASSVLVLATLAGCGSSGTATDSTQAAGTTQQQGGAAGGPGGGPAGQMPGASGTIAAISGKTLQVQNDQSGQVAVTWTAKTAFTQQVDGTLDDVAVGSCVAVTSDGAAADGQPVAATSVRVTEATGDGCGGGMGFSGQRPGGMPSHAPGEMPSDRPSDLPGRMGGGAIGQVTAVTSDGFTVSSTRPGETTATTVDVTVAANTTYSVGADADSAALKVGRCVVASGNTDDTGAVTADRISVSDAVNGQCTSGLPFRSGAGQ